MVLSWSSQATALADPWTVLPTSAPGEGVDPAVVARIVQELESRGAAVLGSSEASRLFREQASSELGPADPALVDEIERVVNELLVHVATGQRPRAYEDGARLERLAAGSAEWLDRDARASRAMQDACLHLVRALVDQRQRARAKEEARRCIGRFPGIEPDIRQHPPEIFGVVGEVRGELLAEPLGTLRIDSDPQGCGAFLNGREVGPTPAEVVRLIPGAYRVQVECPGQPVGTGRVHRVVVAAERNVLLVDAVFDRAVRTTPLLALSYRDRHEQAARRTSDARAIAEVLQVAKVILVTRIARGRYRLDRLDVGPGRIAASVVIAGSPGQVARFGDRTALAVAALVRGDSLAFDVDPPARIEPWPGPERRPARSRPTPAAPPSRQAEVTPRARLSGGRGLAALGWTLSTAGAATIAAGWVVRETGGANADAILATAIGGTVLATIGVPLLLAATDVDGVPWWAWTAGLAGVGLATWGAAAIAADGTCKEQLASGRCLISIRSADAGALLVAAALPLTEVLVFSLARPARALRSASAFLDLRERGAVVGLRGVY